MDCHIFFFSDGAGDMESRAGGDVQGRRRSAPVQGRTVRPPAARSEAVGAGARGWWRRGPVHRFRAAEAGDVTNGRGKGGFVLEFWVETVQQM
jgi:hypothetical protein